MKNLFLLSALSLLVGCASDTALRISVARANIEISKKQAAAFALPIAEIRNPVLIPQFSIDGQGQISVIGLDIKEQVIIIRNPQANHATRVSMPDDPWARVVEKGLDVLGTVSGIAVGGLMATGLVEAVGDGIENALSAQGASVSSAILGVGENTMGAIQASGNNTTGALEQSGAAVAAVVNSIPAPVIVPAPDTIVIPTQIIRPEIIEPTIITPLN